MPAVSERQSGTVQGLEFSGEVALVTGASSGIGRTTALKLAERGARVLAVGRDRKRLDALRDHDRMTVCAAGLDTKDGCLQAIAAARAIGPIAILVNCAGRGGYHDRPIWEQSDEGWLATMAINLHAPFYLTREAAKDMKGLRWGRVVMISSTAGAVGAPSMAPYCASKQAIVGMMRSVARDLAPFGATCNAILPGWVRTEMAEQDAILEASRRNMTPDEVWAERAAENPAKRIATAEELAEMIAFLCSRAASGVNGEPITVSLGSVW